MPRNFCICDGAILGILYLHAWKLLQYLGLQTDFVGSGSDVIVFSDIMYILYCIEIEFCRYTIGHHFPSNVTPEAGERFSTTGLGAHRLLPELGKSDKHRAACSSLFSISRR